MKNYLSPRTLDRVSVALLLAALVNCLVFVDHVQAESPTYVLVDPNSIVGLNELSLGFALDDDWKTWRDSTVRRQLAQQAGFKLVRFFTHKSVSPQPCTYWNETTDVGVFDWSDVDLLVKRIFEIGAEPLICLGGCDSTGQTGLPRGMAKNSSTGLAYPYSWAAYCATWVNHFKSIGAPVRFYEIINELQPYLAPSGWTNIDMTRLSYFARLFNAARAKMQLQNAAVLVSFDFITHKTVLDYWIDHGYSVDTLNFHKYDDFQYPGSTSAQMLGYAESKFFGPWPLGGNSVMASQKTYLSARGETLPLINSESNMNSVYTDGTDPRIQQMQGVVWLALVLRMGILNGVTYNTYYCFSSSETYGMSTPNGGAGFGLINRDDGDPWYPYYVHKMIGTNLSPDDEILKATSSSDNIRAVAWIHGDKLNIMLICKTNQTQQIQLQGVTGQANFFRIDEAISWRSPEVQAGTVETGYPISLRGYTVMLIRTEIPSSPSPKPYFEDGFESKSFDAWTGRVTTRGESAAITDNAYSGMCAAMFDSSGSAETEYEYAYCYKTVQPSSELFARGYFLIAGCGIAQDGDRLYIMKFKAGSNNTAYVGWRQVNGAVIWRLTVRDGNEWAVNSSTMSTSPNKWYCVELHWLADSTVGGAELWVDGEQACSIQSKNTAALGKTDRVIFGIAESYGCAITTVYCDNCKIASAYIGPSGALPPWDVNKDGRVDLFDTGLCTKAFFSTPQSQNWNPKADLNSDLIVNMADVAIIVYHFGEEYN